MDTATREEFLKELQSWLGQPLGISYWAELPVLPRYRADSASDFKSMLAPQDMVPVDTMCQTAAYIWAWIANSQPFLLVRPS